MKKLLVIIAAAGFVVTSNAQSIGIGTNTPNSTAMLDVSSTSKGFLPPRMSGAQRKAIVNPAPGLLVWDTDKSNLMMFDGVNWQALLFSLPSLTPASLRFADDQADPAGYGASVSINNSIAAVGCPFDSTGILEEDEGSVYVYEKINGVWIQTAKLTAADGAAADNFGNGVDVFGDYIVVGAPYSDMNVPPFSYSNAGAVYIFHKTGGSWVQEAKIRANDPAAGTGFGQSVAVFNNQLMVGAPVADNGAMSNCGAVYFYERSGTSWQQLSKFFLTGAAADDLLGTTVDIQDNYAIASAPGANVDTVNDGAVQVFAYSAGAWSKTQRIDNFNNNDPLSDFGWGVAINNQLMVIGVPESGDFGRVDVYERSGNQYYRKPLATLIGTLERAYIGTSVSLSGDTIAVKGRTPSHTNCYVYKYSGGNLYPLRQITIPAEAQFEGFSDKIGISNGNIIVSYPGNYTILPKKGIIAFVNIDN